MAQLKSMVGLVVSNKMNKTVIVAVEKQKQHPLYRKIYKVVVKYQAHDANSQCKPGDKVLVVETRPISKMKRWRVAEILSHGEVPEIKPEEVA